MRRILVGLKVVRPRCAAGAPPRPRLRSTAPRHMGRNETKQGNDQRIPPLPGGPQHRKGSGTMTEKTESTAGTGKAQTVEGRAAGLSEELLKSSESINNAALEAAHKFVDTVEGAAAHAREKPSSAPPWTWPTASSPSSINLCAVVLRSAEKAAKSLATSSSRRRHSLTRRRAVVPFLLAGQLFWRALRVHRRCGRLRDRRRWRQPGTPTGPRSTPTQPPKSLVGSDGTLTGGCKSAASTFNATHHHPAGWVAAARRITARAPGEHAPQAAEVVVHGRGADAGRGPLTQGNGVVDLQACDLG